jgi:hypothetical protein
VPYLSSSSQAASACFILFLPIRLSHQPLLHPTFDSSFLKWESRQSSAVHVLQKSSCGLTVVHPYQPGPPLSASEYAAPCWETPPPLSAGLTLEGICSDTTEACLSSS